MWVDNDLYWTCAMNDIAINRCPDLKFQHLHHSIGKAEYDDTYKHSDSFTNEGKKTFIQRQLQNFPL